MSKIGTGMPDEYSDHFDELRQNRVATSYYKYGTAVKNFGDHLVNALESANLCIEKYKRTGNTEYLCDAANYIMFEFMYPSVKDAYFKATDSKDSAGIVGTSVNEMYKDQMFGFFDPESLV